jgi:hypothetical protein
MALRRRDRKLPLTGSGFQDFRIEGGVDGVTVRAAWDGRQLALSEPLYHRVLLAVAVDEAYVECGLAPAETCSTLCGSPADVILTLARCCDTLLVVEYTRCRPCST